MRAIRRETVVVLIAAGMIACGETAATKMADTHDAAADDAGASSGQVAARACSPLAPPAFLTLEAMTPDGHYLVVTKDPSTASSATVTHLFYGTPDHMIEAHLTHESFSCAWSPSFESAGATYTAVIAPSSCGNNVLSRIYVGNDPMTVPMPLSLLRGEVGPNEAGATASPETFTYSCF